MAAPRTDVHAVLTFTPRHPGVQGMHGALVGGDAALLPPALDGVRAPAAEAAAAGADGTGHHSAAQLSHPAHYDARAGQTEPKFVFSTGPDACDMRVGTRKQRRASK